MASGCSSLGCVDARTPMRANYLNLYKWPESDAEFVKSVSGGRNHDINDRNSSRFDGKRRSSSPAVVDSYACRQMFLRSYTFSKPESFPEKTRRCLGKVKDSAAVFPFLSQRSTTTDDHSSTTCMTGKKIQTKEARKKKKMKKKKKKKNNKENCGTARKLRELSYLTLHSIFRRLLSCTTSVDVVDPV